MSSTTEQSFIDKLFAAVVNDFPVERKNRDRVTIPFEESPKFLISTNYVVAGKGGSHRARVFEVEGRPNPVAEPEAPARRPDPHVVRPSPRQTSVGPLTRSRWCTSIPIH